VRIVVGLRLPPLSLSLLALGFGYFTLDWAIFVVFVEVSRKHDFLLKLVLEGKNLHVPSTVVESGNGIRESHGRMLYD
jgi:hypothetical protein